MIAAAASLKVFALNGGVDVDKVGDVDVDADGAGNNNTILTSLSSPLTTSELLEHIFDDDSNSSIPSFSFPCSPFIPSVPFSSSNPCPCPCPPSIPVPTPTSTSPSSSPSAPRVELTLNGHPNQQLNHGQRRLYLHRSLLNHTFRQHRRK